jgi:hypothetical protein
MILFSKEEYEDDDDLSSRTCCMLAAMDTKYLHLLKLDSPYSFITLERKRSATTTNIFRSLDMLIPRIFLLVFDSIATQSQMYSEITLI